MIPAATRLRLQRVWGGLNLYGFGRPGVWVRFRALGEESGETAESGETGESGEV